MRKSRAAAGHRVARTSTRDERGDPSVKALKATVVVCMIGLIGVYLFAFAPKNATKPVAGGPSRTPQAKEAVATFDRESLSTKTR